MLHRMIRRLKCLATGLDAFLSSFSTSRQEFFSLFSELTRKVYNDRNKCTLNAIIFLLNQPEVSTSSLVIDQENILQSLERTAGNKAHMLCLLGSYCAL